MLVNVSCGIICCCPVHPPEGAMHTLPHKVVKRNKLFALLPTEWSQANGKYNITSRYNMSFLAHPSLISKIMVGSIYPFFIQSLYTIACIGFTSSCRPADENIFGKEASLVYCRLFITVCYV